MSASRRPTRAPWAARASARLAATVDFPTPPFPDAGEDIGDLGQGVHAPVGDERRYLRTQFDRKGLLEPGRGRMAREGTLELLAIPFHREAEHDLRDQPRPGCLDGLHGRGGGKRQAGIRLDILRKQGLQAALGAGGHRRHSADRGAGIVAQEPIRKWRPAAGMSYFPFVRSVPTRAGVGWDYSLDIARTA